MKYNYYKIIIKQNKNYMQETILVNLYTKYAKYYNFYFYLFNSHMQGKKT